MLALMNEWIYEWWLPIHLTHITSLFSSGIEVSAEPLHKNTIVSIVWGQDWMKRRLMSCGWTAQSPSNTRSTYTPLISEPSAPTTTKTGLQESTFCTVVAAWMTTAIPTDLKIIIIRKQSIVRTCCLLKKLVLFSVVKVISFIIY